MTAASPQLPMSIQLAEAFWYCLKPGFVSFGGPAGQIALMHADLVERRHWISEQRFLHALSYCMLLPGPEATRLAVYIGWLVHGTLGSIIAGILFILPGLAVLIGLSWIHVAFGSVPLVAAALYGIKPAVVAIVLAAAWRIGSRTLKNRWLAGLALLAFIAIAVAHLPFPAVVAAAALLELIDDTTPTPRHAHFSWSKLTMTSACSIAIGLLVWMLVALRYGVGAPLAGVLGACTATFFTFLPSFLFILAGGLLIESTRENIRFTALLTVLSAAVVGVIASLAVFFADHVFHLTQPERQWDFVAMTIAALATVALPRFKAGTIKLIGVCALAGLVVSYPG